MAHERLRRFDTSVFGKDRVGGNTMCMAVRAGNHVFLRGQSGMTLEGGFVGLGDAGAQAEQAMRNVEVLLEEAGARMGDVRKVTTYLTDRAWREAVEAVIGRHLGGAVVGTGVIVSGLAMPEMLVAVDVEAVIAG